MSQEPGRNPNYPLPPQTQPGYGAPHPGQQHHPQPGAPGYPYGYQAPPEPPGRRHESTGLVLGIIGLVNGLFLSLFVVITGPLSLLFGVLSIWQGAKAQRGDANGTPGKVLGWINVALGILWTIIVAGMAVFVWWTLDQSPQQNEVPPIELS